MRKINILLADDDLDDCMLFNEALQELSLPTSLRTVNDGEQLIKVITNVLNDKNENLTELPDVIFLDLNMPRKNGLTCLEEIKRHEKLKGVPVIIFSTSYEERIADLLYKNGAHFYICKPAEFPQLKNEIRQVLTIIEEKELSQPPREKFLISN